MIHLLDGPAKGQYGVRRAPIYLRAVVDASGKVDVLDLLPDAPMPGERVHVYRADPGTTMMLADNIFVCVRDAKGEGMHQAAGASGTYRHLPDVDGEALRETAAWRDWVGAQPEPVR